MNSEMKLMNWLQQESIELSSNKKHLKALIKADVMGLVDHIELGVKAYQEYLEGDYWDSKNNRISSILHLSPYEVVLDALCAVATINGYAPVQQVIGQLAPTLGFEDVFDGVKTAGEILGVVSDCKAFAFSKVKDRMVIINYIDLDADTKKAIEHSMFAPPSLVPVKVDHNLSGYVSYKQSVLLGKTEHHEGDMCLDVIQIQNHMNLCLDEYMLEYEEESTKESQIDTPDKLKAFEVMKVRSREVYELMVQNQNSFYLPHSNDGRGRLYSRGYHVAHQAGQYKRAMININEAHYMSE